MYHFYRTLSKVTGFSWTQCICVVWGCFKSLGHATLAKGLTEDRLQALEVAGVLQTRHYSSPHDCVQGL